MAVIVYFCTDLVKIASPIFFDIFFENSDNSQGISTEFLEKVLKPLEYHQNFGNKYQNTLKVIRISRKSINLTSAVHPLKIVTYTTEYNHELNYN